MWKTYSQDGRWPIEKLYQSFSVLEKKFGWQVEKIYEQKVGEALLPILGLRTRKEGQAFWLIAGNHGEEPAGPIALAQNVEFLGRLGEKTPLVLLPLCNPVGYLRDWSNPTQRRDETRTGASVGDSRHLLPDLENPQKPRLEKPICPEAEALTFWVIKIAQKYHPYLAIDFHEDEDKSGKEPYIFFNGEKGAEDPLAKEVVAVLLKNGQSLQMKGKSPYGEIINGIVSNAVDDSIDELLSAKKIILQGKVVKGPSAERVVTIETSTVGVPLEKRVKAHSEILRSVEKFWRQASLGIPG